MEEREKNFSADKEGRRIPLLGEEIYNVKSPLLHVCVEERVG
jgi:hypothetical protein